MAGSWGYVPNDVYKPTRQLIHLLADIVSKGGNLLLDVGPNPSGDLEPIAYDRLREIGDWMKVNGEAIYATRPVAPHREGNLRFTRSKGGAVYVLYLAGDGEGTMPATIRITGIRPATNATCSLLGTTAKLTWTNDAKGVTFTIPDAVRAQPPSRHAWVIRMTATER
jgi:alpha-L-fucosidase